MPTANSRELQLHDLSNAHLLRVVTLVGIDKLYFTTRG